MTPSDFRTKNCWTHDLTNLNCVSELSRDCLQTVGTSCWVPYLQLDRVRYVPCSQTGWWYVVPYSHIVVHTDLVVKLGLHPRTAVTRHKPHSAHRPRVRRVTYRTPKRTVVRHTVLPPRCAHRPRGKAGFASQGRSDSAQAIVSTSTDRCSATSAPASSAT